MSKNTWTKRGCRSAKQTTHKLENTPMNKSRRTRKNIDKQGNKIKSQPKNTMHKTLKT
jgi:hypothetical protein